MQTIDFIGFSAHALSLNIIHAVIALALLWLILRQADRMSGLEFKALMIRSTKDKELSLPVALYLAARPICVAIILAAFIS